MALDRLHLRKRRRQAAETKFNMLFNDAFRSAYDKVVDCAKRKQFVKMIYTR